MNDFVIFLKYMFDLSGIKKPQSWSYIFIILALISYFLIENSTYKIILVAVFLLIGGVILPSYLIYKSGMHRGWYRKKIRKVYIHKNKIENSGKIAEDREEIYPEENKGSIYEKKI